MGLFMICPRLPAINKEACYFGFFILLSVTKGLGLYEGQKLFELLVIPAFFLGAVKLAVTPYTKQKRTQGQIRDMQDIRMAESQAPAKDRPKPHLGMYPVHRMLYAQKGKDTQKDRTHRPGQAGGHALYEKTVGDAGAFGAACGNRVLEFS